VEEVIGEIETMIMIEAGEIVIVIMTAGGIVLDQGPAPAPLIVIVGGVLGLDRGIGT